MRVQRHRLPGGDPSVEDPDIRIVQENPMMFPSRDNGVQIAVTQALVSSILGPLPDVPDTFPDPPEGEVRPVSSRLGKVSGPGN